MQNRVEPPILLSRLLTLVFAASLVVLIVLMVTLYNLFPLDRPEVFLLHTADPTSTEITLSQIMPNGSDFEEYKHAFIAEYIKMRNEIVPNLHTMDRQWASVQTMSTDDVYADFAGTDLYRRVKMHTISGTDLGITCVVDIPTHSINSYTSDRLTYTVGFQWVCTNSYGQTTRKDYRMKIGLTTDDTQTMTWADHMENPLGLRVVEYTVDSGDGDPLNAFSNNE